MSMIIEFWDEAPIHCCNADQFALSRGKLFAAISLDATEIMNLGFHSWWIDLCKYLDFILRKELNCAVSVKYEFLAI